MLIFDIYEPLSYTVALNYYAQIFPQHSVPRFHKQSMKNFGAKSFIIQQDQIQFSNTWSHRPLVIVSLLLCICLPLYKELLIK